MAANKTITANGSKGHHYFSLNASESRTEGNSSYLSGSFSMGPLQNNWDWYNWGSAISYSVVVGSNEFTGTIPSYNGTSVLYLQTFNNIEIPHNNDGTKTIDISFNVSDTTGVNYTCGNASASDKLELTQLHKHPDINTVEVVETGFSDSVGVPDTTLINLLSVKHFLFSNITLYDNATLKQVDIYGENFSFTFSGDDITNNDDTLNLTCWFSNFNINSSKTAIPCNIQITDSLGGKDNTVVEFSYVNYQYPNIIETQSNVKRNGQLTGKAKLNLLGSFSNMKIGTIMNIPSLKYRYYEYGTTPSDTLEYITIPTSAYDIDNNSISIYNWNISNNNVEISDLDKSKAYSFDIILSDSFIDTTSSGKTFTVTLICSKGEWLMAKFKDRVDFQKITVSGYNPFEYSTNETIIGTWVDDKPIYRQMLDDITIQIGISQEINFEIPNVDNVIKIQAVISTNAPNYQYKFSNFYFSPNDYFTILYSKIDKKIYYDNPATTGTMSIIIEYTKTTDEGGI